MPCSDVTAGVGSVLVSLTGDRRLTDSEAIARRPPVDVGANKHQAFIVDRNLIGVN